MIKVNSIVQINHGLIRKLTQGQIRALEQTTEALHTDVVQNQVIPRDEGTLQNVKTFVDYEEAAKGKTSIVHEGPYARRLYYHPEYHFQKVENPNAKGNWYEDWLKGGKKEDFAKKAFKEFYRRESGL